MTTNRKTTTIQARNVKVGDEVETENNGMRRVVRRALAGALRLNGDRVVLTIDDATGETDLVYRRDARVVVRRAPKLTPEQIAASVSGGGVVAGVRYLGITVRDGRYLLNGGYFGSHSLDVQNTTPERLQAHWQGYVEKNREEAARLDAEVKAQHEAARAARREEGGPVDAYLDVEPGDVVLTMGPGILWGARREVVKVLRHHVTCEATLYFADGTSERCKTVNMLPAVAADEWKQNTEQRVVRRGWSPYDAKVPASKRGN